MAKRLLDQLGKYQGAGKPNPVVLPVPAHERWRVRHVGELLPVERPPIPMDPSTVDWQMWAGPRELVVMVASEQSAHGLLLHLSASHPKRLPDYWEMIGLREWAFPDTVDCAMIFPRRKDWVNVMEYCLHLHQIPVEWGLR